MQKKTFNRYSILGLIIMGASAIAAAVVTDSNKETEQLQYYGTLTASSLGFYHALTCTVTNNINMDICTASTAMNSRTTIIGETLSDDDGRQTDIFNTTI